MGPKIVAIMSIRRKIDFFLIEGMLIAKQLFSRQLQLYVESAPRRVFEWNRNTWSWSLAKHDLNHSTSAFFVSNEHFLPSQHAQHHAMQNGSASVHSLSLQVLSPPTSTERRR